MDVIAPSSLPTTALRLLSIATKLPPDVCLRSSLLAFLSLILAAPAACVHPCLDSLLTCSSISSLLIPCSIPKKMSKVPLHLLTYFFLAHHAEPFNKVHLTAFVGVLHFTPVLRSSLSPKLSCECFQWPHQPLQSFAQPREEGATISPLSQVCTLSSFSYFFPLSSSLSSACCLVLSLDHFHQLQPL